MTDVKDSMVMASPLQTSRFESSGTLSLLKSDRDLVIAGYASVEMVDKQGDLITTNALKGAFDGFMKAEGFRNVQLAHSNIQVGSVIPEYTDSSGRLWKSGVDDAGLFVVIQVRDDIEKAREVANEIRKGALRGFSIGGQAFKRMKKADQKHGDYTEISKLELHEVTICEKGINPEATFRILKEDTTMTENTDMNTMSELSSVLDRINTRLDVMEKGDKPAFLEEKKDDDKDEDKGKEMADDKKEEKMYGSAEHKGMHGDMEKSEYSDVITQDYLHWMENTLKSGGVDIAGARSHFDALEKAQLGGFDNPSSIDGAEYFGGQTRGRAQEGGNPSTGAIGKLNSGSKADVAKGYLSPEDLSAAQLEEAYAAYKAASIEKQLKGTLSEVFADRLAKEQRDEAHSRQAQAFDARAPLANIEKAVAALSDRIDNLGSGSTGTSIQKSAVSNIEIPSTVDMGNMSWDEVHSLAGSIFNQ
jgi:HK97 family phage prohead protease